MWKKISPNKNKMPIAAILFTDSIIRSKEFKKKEYRWRQEQTPEIKI